MALAFEKKKKLHYGRDVAGVYRGDHGFKSSSSKFPIYCWMFALILKNATLDLHDQGKALPWAALPSQITHPTAGTQSWEQSSPKHCAGKGNCGGAGHSRTQPKWEPEPASWISRAFGRRGLQGMVSLKTLTCH